MPLCKVVAISASGLFVMRVRHDQGRDSRGCTNADFAHEHEIALLSTVAPHSHSSMVAARREHPTCKVVRHPAESQVLDGPDQLLMQPSPKDGTQGRRRA